MSANVEALTGHPEEEFASGRLPYASLIRPEIGDASASAAWSEHEPYRLRQQLATIDNLGTPIVRAEVKISGSAVRRRPRSRSRGPRRRPSA